MAPHCTNVGVGPDNVILYGKYVIDEKLVRV